MSISEGDGRKSQQADNVWYLPTVCQHTIIFFSDPSIIADISSEIFEKTSITVIWEIMCLGLYFPLLYIKIFNCLLVSFFKKAFSISLLYPCYAILCLETHAGSWQPCHLTWGTVPPCAQQRTSFWRAEDAGEFSWSAPVSLAGGWLFPVLQKPGWEPRTRSESSQNNQLQCAVL